MFIGTNDGLEHTTGHRSTGKDGNEDEKEAKKAAVERWHMKCGSIQIFHEIGHALGA